jgi:hypothetical protein
MVCSRNTIPNRDAGEGLPWQTLRKKSMPGA